MIFLYGGYMVQLICFIILAVLCVAAQFSKNNIFTGLVILVVNFLLVVVSNNTGLEFISKITQLSENNALICVIILYVLATIALIFIKLPRISKLEKVIKEADNIIYCQLIEKKLKKIIKGIKGNKYFNKSEVFIELYTINKSYIYRKVNRIAYSGDIPRIIIERNINRMLILSEFISDIKSEDYLVRDIKNDNEYTKRLPENIMRYYKENIPVVVNFPIQIQYPVGKRMVTEVAFIVSLNFLTDELKVLSSNVGAFNTIETLINKEMKGIENFYRYYIYK